MTYTDPVSRLVAPITLAQIDAVCAGLRGVVPIPPVDKCSDDDGVHKQRWKTAFPLRLARASTVHRVQGASLAKMILKLGSKERPGVSYTAFSRGTSVESVLLMPPYDDKRLVGAINGDARAAARNKGKSLAENMAVVAAMAAASMGRSRARRFIGRPLGAGQV